MIGAFLSHKNFHGIRYGRCWEDADVLLEGLKVSAGDDVLSIGSAGDNSLALLSRAPAKIYVVDYNQSQLHCLELRIAAYRVLEYRQTMELLGVLPCNRRQALYRSCRKILGRNARHYWDQYPELIAKGIINAGKLDRYLAAFRCNILPLVHPRERVEKLLRLSDVDARREFFNRAWDTWRWRLLFRVFFSRWCMARSGRDAACFHHVREPVAASLLRQVESALVARDPEQNPYLHWILTGDHGPMLPYAWREENYTLIKANLDRLQCHCVSLQQFLTELQEASIDRFNLSDVFEYLDPVEHVRLFTELVRVARPGARLAYWNLFVDRQRPPELAHRINDLSSIAAELQQRDRGFFYRRFVLEEVV